MCNLYGTTDAQHLRTLVFVKSIPTTGWDMTVAPLKTGGSSVDFLRRVHKAAPLNITKLLTDNVTQFTDRFTSKDKQPTGNHVFDKQCQALNIEHRLAPPRHPQTNGMVERCNGRISEVVEQTRFASAAELDATLNNYMFTYHHHIPQRALGYLSPIDTLKSWREKSQNSSSSVFINRRNLTRK